MAMQEVFSIYDTKAQMFNLPFFQLNSEIAKRAFLALVRDPNTSIGQFPADYALFRIGTFTDQDGCLNSETPVQVLTGVEARAMLASLEPELFSGKYADLSENVATN